MRKLWSGELPLRQAFWLCLPVMYILIFVSDAVLASPLLLLTFLGLWAAFMVVALVGIWRSADRYDGHDHWAILSKAAVTLSGFFLTIKIMTVLGTIVRLQGP